MFDETAQEALRVSPEEPERINDTDKNGADDDSGGTGSKADDSEDPSLPKLTVAKLVQEMMPDNFQCPKDTRDLLVACCTEFVHLITSEANEACERASKKMIGPEHLLEALKNLGFGEYCQEVEQALQEQQQAAKVKAERQKRANPVSNSSVGEEELARQQAELFEKARLKYLGKQ